MQLRRKITGEILNFASAKLLGAGGEARVFAVAGNQPLAAKIYHRPTPERTAKLAAMLANPPADPMAAKGHISIAWPIDLLLTLAPRPRVVGYLMPLVSGMHPIIDFYHPKTRRQRFPLFNWLYLLRTGRNLAAAVRALHHSDYVIGDINESNILVAETALVTLVDTDSFQVPDPVNGRVYRCLVGKPGFTPPELQDKSFADVDRKPEHDRFGLAVLLFQLLMEGTHPFAGCFTGQGEAPQLEKRIAAGDFPYAQNRRVHYAPMPGAPPFELLPPHLRELFIKCFEQGHRDPSARPDAFTWQCALEEAEQKLLICRVNEQHRYGDHLPSCPWCERRDRLLGGVDPFPSRQAALQAHRLVSTPIQQPTPQTTPRRAPPGPLPPVAAPPRVPAPRGTTYLLWASLAAAGLSCWAISIGGPPWLVWLLASAGIIFAWGARWRATSGESRFAAGLAIALSLGAAAAQALLNLAVTAEERLLSPVRPGTQAVLQVQEAQLQTEAQPQAEPILKAKAEAAAKVSAVVAPASVSLQPEQHWTNSLGMVFAHVWGATAFSIWETRVQDYAAFVQATGRNWPRPHFNQEPTHPAVNVSWEDARAFCRWLTQKERQMGLLSANQFYRLPTDAEWSMAVGLLVESGITPRDKDGKIRGVYPWGAEWPPPEGAGNYNSSLGADSFDYTATVGSFPPNAFALHDLGGNVWEWCSDEYYPGSGTRVLRGASWINGNRDNLLSSRRYHNAPDYRNDSFGFRCVLVTGSAPWVATDKGSRDATFDPVQPAQEGYPTAPSVPEKP